MAQFYVSHAYKDRGFANTLISWLAEHAFSSGLSTFVRTPRHAGNRNHPTQAIKAIQESDAVVMLCSPAWAACKQCYAEYVAAQASGKFLVALVIKKPARKLTLAPGIPRFVVDDVGRDLSNLVSVLSAFERADPYCYDWTPDRSPYPGVRAFNPDEAGVFFGRNNDIQYVVAKISAQLESEANCLTILVGPTGSGVSSLLSAGVIPALARNAADNFILPAVRPRLRPVDSLAVSIASALGAPDTWRRWSDRFTRAAADDLGEFVATCVDELREHAGNPDARLLIPIDQLEELFEVSDPVQTRTFEAFIAVISASDAPVHVIATLGAEHVKTFKKSRLGVCEWRPMTIEPIPLERYGELVRGPAQRAGIFIEDALVERILADAAEITEDRLSLVAYLLRLFWRLESPFGHFSQGLYERFNNGDLEMPTLEAAIALGAELAVDDADATFQSRQTIGPALVNLAVRWDVNSRPVRTPFTLEEVPRDKIEVLNRLQDAGLAAKVRVGDQHLVEVTSPALFRHWPRLERLLRAQSEGPDIVMSHCREVLCVPAPGQTRSIRSRLLTGSAIVLDDAMSATVCLLAILMTIAPIWQGDLRDETGSRSGGLSASLIENLPPVPPALQQDENTKQAITPAAIATAAHETHARISRLADTAPAKVATAAHEIHAWISRLADTAPAHEEATPVHAETASANDKTAAHESYTGMSRLAAAIQPARQPAILPAILLSEMKRLKPPSISPAGGAGQPSAKDVDEVSAAQLPELLEIIHRQPSSSRATTHMLIALEALLHPKAALLTGQQRSMLRQLIQRRLKPHFKPRSFPIRHGRLFAATFSPSGKHIASASSDGVARLWNADSGVETNAFMGHKGAIYGVAYSRDGSKLVTSSQDRTARIWNTDASGNTIVLKGHKGAVYRASFSPAAERVVTASADGSAIIWDVNAARQLEILKGHDGAVWSASFSPDGKRILTTSKDKTARIWRSDTGQPVTRLVGHKADVVAGVFSPDGNKVATGSRDGSVRIWDSRSGHETANLLGHAATVFSTRFSGDGLFLITASFDGTAKIWELATGQIVADFRTDGSEMRNAELTSDGQFLRTVTGDGTVAKWPVALTPEQLLENVLRATNGCLSATERGALDLSANSPWWCRLSRRNSNFDVARTKQ